VDEGAGNANSFFLKITLSSVRPSRAFDQAEQAAVLTVEDNLFHGLK
jgi:hypothetical protein